MSKITGFATERTKPFPITEINFSRNEISAEGIGAVVQFARTQGADAATIDLSRNKIDDQSAADELTRLVKNYSSFAANSFISTLHLSGNDIGRVGARRCAAARRLPDSPESSAGACAFVARSPRGACAEPLVRRRVSSARRRRDQAHPVCALGAGPVQERSGAASRDEARLVG